MEGPKQGNTASGSGPAAFRYAKECRVTHWAFSHPNSSKEMPLQRAEVEQERGEEE